MIYFLDTAGRQRLFTFRDGTSPNDTIRMDVELQAGTLGRSYTDLRFYGE